MPSERTNSEFVPERRVHRLSWIFVAAEYVRHFIFPLLAAVFVGARDGYALWGLALVVPLIAGALWHQRVYRYGFGPRGLVIREGLVFRNIRTIDYSRIENVDTQRNILHRLLNVAQVRIETSSGGSSEAVVRVLDMPAVQEMRQRIFEARESPVAPAEKQAAEETLLHLGPAELVRYGLVDNRGMIVVAAAFGLLAQTGTYEAMERWVAPLLSSSPFMDLDNFAALGPIVQVLLVVSTVAGLVAGTRLLSILLAFITLHDFRLVQRNEDLRVTHGLFTRMALTMRRPRIQAVHRKATLLHRLFGRVSLRVDLAGGLAASQGRQAQANDPRKLWLAPVCTPEKARELVRIALPTVCAGQIDWQRLSPRAGWRLFRLSAWLWLLLAGAPSAWFLGAWSLAVLLPGFPLLWVNAHLYVKHTGWALHDEFFALRRGWLTRRLSIAPRNRIQSVRLSESPFDRRYRMASLGVDTAGASSTHLRIPYLDVDSARSLADALYGSEKAGPPAFEASAI